VGAHDENMDGNIQEENGRNNMRSVRGNKELAMLQMMLPKPFERVDEGLP
jgi:hypothetical protein